MSTSKVVETLSDGRELEIFVCENPMENKLMCRIAVYRMVDGKRVSGQVSVLDIDPDVFPTASAVRSKWPDFIRFVNGLFDLGI